MTPATRQLTLALASAASLAAAHADPQRVFDAGDATARHAIVAAPWATVEPGSAPRVPDSPMLREIAGLLADLSAADLARLRRAVARDTRVPADVTIRDHVASLHLFAADRAARVELERVDHGWILASNTQSGVRARLHDDPATQLLAAWPVPRPDPVDAAAATPDHVHHPGTTFSLERPYTPSSIRLDEPTASARFSAGGPSPFEAPLSRDLAAEHFAARLPAGHRPDRPSPLLVWLPTNPDAPIPDAIAKAADDLGLICIASATATGARAPLDRMQLALDAVATATARWWIDRERVYVAGLAQGARSASTLLTCFPDVFTGALAVAGLDSHHNTPLGDGRVWPASHAPPSRDTGRLLARHRLAVITGPRDPDFAEIRARVRLLEHESRTVRVFDHARLRPDRPEPEYLDVALSWIDANVTEARAAAAERARPLLAAYLAEHGNAAPGNDDRAARSLERITVIAPWTDPAWHAAELLGYTRPSPAPAPATPAP